MARAGFSPRAELASEPLNRVRADTEKALYATMRALSGQEEVVARLLAE